MKGRYVLYNDGSFGLIVYDHWGTLYVFKYTGDDFRKRPDRYFRGFTYSDSKLGISFNSRLFNTVGQFRYRLDVFGNSYDYRYINGNTERVLYKQAKEALLKAMGITKTSTILRGL